VSAAAGTWKLGDLEANRLGYGAMRLTGNGMKGNSDGTPIDHDVAAGLLHSAFEQVSTTSIRPPSTSRHCGPRTTSSTAPVLLVRRRGRGDQGRPGARSGR
jgi:hypothetical protein